MSRGKACLDFSGYNGDRSWVVDTSSRLINIHFESPREFGTRTKSRKYGPE